MNDIISSGPSGELINGIAVHPEIADLIWIGDGPFKNLEIERREDYIEIEGIKILFGRDDDEPSLIYTKLPVKFDDETEEFPYFPSYSELSAIQRGEYLNFLKDPFSGSADIGCVFLLFYGLERHLFFGNYDHASEVVLRLRRIYDNGSFQSHSATSLIFSSLKNNRPDVIEAMFEERNPEYDNKINKDLFLYMKYGLQSPLNPNDIMMLARAFGHNNTKYMRHFKELYYKMLSKNIGDTGNVDLKRFVQNTEKDSFEKTAINVCANVSIRNSVIEIPAISSHEGLREYIKALLKKTDKEFKAYLDEQEKQGVTVEETNPTPKKTAVFNYERETELINELENSCSFSDKYFACSNLSEFYYYYRELSEENVRLSEEYAKKQLDLLIKVEAEHRLGSHRHLLRKEAPIEESELPEVHEFKEFAVWVQGFDRLSIIYENEGRFLDALEICDRALDYYYQVNLEADADKYEKKKLKIMKKYIQAELQKMLEMQSVFEICEYADKLNLKEMRFNDEFLPQLKDFAMKERLYGRQLEDCKAYIKKYAKKPI